MCKSRGWLTLFLQPELGVCSLIFNGNKNELAYPRCSHTDGLDYDGVMFSRTAHSGDPAVVTVIGSSVFIFSVCVYAVIFLLPPYMGIEEKEGKRLVGGMCYMSATSCLYTFYLYIYINKKFLVAHGHPPSRSCGGL